MWSADPKILIETYIMNDADTMWSSNPIKYLKTFTETLQFSYIDMSKKEESSQSACKCKVQTITIWWVTTWKVHRQKFKNDFPPTSNAIWAHMYMYYP